MKKTEVVIEKRCLTYKELANVYTSMTGKHYTGLKDGELMAWARKQPDKFLINEDGVHLLVTK